ncbi:MAG: hypothetical protein NMNS01_05050 [Nitrosomonas sp.]|nr:MAG: hypothetical protein NMNS01_05050 [Nitrosomonas sp.]
MSEADSLSYYLSQNAEQRVIEQKIEFNPCFSKPEIHGLSSESVYLYNHFQGRLEEVREDENSKSAILCIPIPENGTIPKILNDVFNIDAVTEIIEMALGTGEKPTPDVDIPIDEPHKFFETEILEGEEAGEDNMQEIRATGVLKFFDLIPDWLASKLDASIVPFEDRWLATLDVFLKSTGHIIVSPIPPGMKLDPGTDRRIIVTSFMKGTVNTNVDVPYPMDVELDYDPILGVLDDEITIPGAGERSIMAINELFDSGGSASEQVNNLKGASRQQADFMNDVMAEIIPDSQGKSGAVEDDELLEVELTLTGHRKEEIDLVLEYQVVLYVDPKHLAAASAQLKQDMVFLTADISLSFGLYNPGAPPEGWENKEKNDYLQFYLNIKNGSGGSLADSVKLKGGPLLDLAKLKLPAHLPHRKPEQLDRSVSLHNDIKSEN